VAVSVNESALLDAGDSTGVEQYEFAADIEGAFRDPTSQSLTTVRYEQPGTYEPQVRVTGPDGDTDVASCGEITVTEGTATPTQTATTTTPTQTITATPTQTPIGTPTVTPTATVSLTGTPSTTGTVTATATAIPTGATTRPPTGTATPTVSVGTPTSEGIASATATPVLTVGTPTDGGTWFRYRRVTSGTNDSVRLVAQPAVSREAVDSFGWDVDGDGTADFHGRVLELPRRTGEETSVTLRITRTNGSTVTVSRTVPVGSDLAVDTTASGGDGATAFGTTLALPAVLVLLLVIVAAVLAARSRTTD
jgi:hypothetical protein